MPLRGKIVMEEIKKQLKNINVAFIVDDSTRKAMTELLKVNLLLIEKLEKIPDWVFYDDNNCCPPGEDCCNCD